MSPRLQKIIILAAVGVGAAIVIGLLGARGGGSGSGGGSTEAQVQAQEQAQSQQALCSSLASLRSATGTLTSLDPQTASKTDYQTAVAAVQTNWQLVVAQAKTVSSTSMTSLDDAWTSFDSAVKAVPSGDSVSQSLQAISSQAKTLSAATQTEINDLSC